jgi:hypothetical protein
MWLGSRKLWRSSFITTSTHRNLSSRRTSTRDRPHGHVDIGSDFALCSVPNFYAPYFRQQLTAQASLHTAAEAMASSYLDGKPRFAHHRVDGKSQTPQGSPCMAARILDFWTSDWISLLAQVRNSQAGFP